MTDQRPVAPIARDFVSVSRQRLRDSQARIEACLGKLSEDQIWSRQVEVENAVGNLVLHLCGNVTQLLLGGIGGQQLCHVTADAGPSMSSGRRLVLSGSAPRR